MTNTTGSLSINCTCPTLEGLAPLIANPFTYCCPANTAVSNAICGCDATLANAGIKYYRFNDTTTSLWMCVT